MFIKDLGNHNITHDAETLNFSRSNCNNNRSESNDYHGSHGNVQGSDFEGDGHLDSTDACDAEDDLKIV